MSYKGSALRNPYNESLRKLMGNLNEHRQIVLCSCGRKYWAPKKFDIFYLHVYECPNCGESIGQLENSESWPYRRIGPTVVAA